MPTFIVDDYDYEIRDNNLLEKIDVLDELPSGGLYFFVRALFKEPKEDYFYLQVETKDGETISKVLIDDQEEGVKEIIKNAFYAIKRNYKDSVIKILSGNLVDVEVYRDGKIIWAQECDQGRISDIYVARSSKDVIITDVDVYDLETNKIIDREVKIDNSDLTELSTLTLEILNRPLKLEIFEHERIK